MGGRPVAVWSLMSFLILLLLALVMVILLLLLQLLLVTLPLPSSGLCALLPQPAIGANGRPQRRPSKAASPPPVATSMLPLPCAAPAACSPHGAHRISCSARSKLMPQQREHTVNAKHIGLHTVFHLHTPTDCSRSTGAQVLSTSGATATSIAGAPEHQRQQQHHPLKSSNPVTSEDRRPWGGAAAASTAQKQQQAALQQPLLGFAAETATATANGPDRVTSYSSFSYTSCTCRPPNAW